MCDRASRDFEEAIYENTYVNTARADMPKNMTLVEKTLSSFEIEVNGSDDIASLFLMTPYYWRTKESDKETNNDSASGYVFPAARPLPPNDNTKQSIRRNEPSWVKGALQRQ